MKYMLFAWYDHEAQGGMNDMRGLFNTVEEAEAQFLHGITVHRFQYDSGQIVNATSLQVEKEL